VVVGKRRKARLIDWQDLSGFGPDAIMVADEKRNSGSRGTSGSRQQHRENLNSWAGAP